MEIKSTNNNLLAANDHFSGRRKASCATIVPPGHAKYKTNRKASLVPPHINTTAATRNLFFDTGSMTDSSPITVVSYRTAYNQPLQPQLQQHQHQHQHQHQKGSWIGKCKDIFARGSKSSKHPDQRIYSDPHVSPSSTAVEDEESQGYFKTQLIKKRLELPKGWVAAGLMIVFGALIAATFVLVGLGKTGEQKDT